MSASNVYSFKGRQRAETRTNAHGGGMGKARAAVLLAAGAAVVIAAFLFLRHDGQPEDEVKTDTPKRSYGVKEVAPAPRSTNSAPVAVTVPTESQEKVIQTPRGPKTVKVHHSKAVQAALRSAHVEPIQSFVQPPRDPNEPPPPPPRYRNILQGQLAEFAWSGQFVGVPDPMTDKEARKMLEEPIEILASDSDEVAAEKQTVMAMQKELKEYMDNGGHADDYFMQLMRRQDAEAETVREARSQIRDLYKSGDIELGDQALVKFNEYLKGKGLPAIKESPLMKRYRMKAKAARESK